MQAKKDVYSIKKWNDGVIICLKMTLILGVFFGCIFKQFSIEGMLISIGISGLYSFGLGYGNGVLNSWLSTKWDWITQTNQRVAAGIIGTILYTIPVVLGINYLIFIILNKNDPSTFFSKQFYLIHLFYVILSLGVSTFMHARDFMINWKNEVLKETNKQKIVAKTASAKFESLKNQIDPHFLFNSLNVLSSLIAESPKLAEKFTTKLSKIYRYVLEQRNKDLILLEEELNFAKNYMELLKMRFEDAIEFEIMELSVNEQYKIVPLSLQLLLENAVKHNVLSSRKPLKLKIYINNNYLNIENTIQKKETIVKSTKVGLQNIADRYGLLTDKEVMIKNNHQLFTVSLPLLTKNNSTMITQIDKKEKYIKAVKKVEKMKEFYKSLFSYILIIPLLIFINLRYSSEFHWFWFPLVGWGIGIIFQALEVYGYNPFLGKNWEEKKIRELMNDDTKTKWE